MKKQEHSNIMVITESKILELVFVFLNEGQNGRRIKSFFRRDKISFFNFVS